MEGQGHREGLGMNLRISEFIAKMKLLAFNSTLHFEA